MKYIAFLLSVLFLLFLIFGIKKHSVPKVVDTHVQDSLKYWKFQDSVQTLIADTILNHDIVIFKDEYDEMKYKKFELDSIGKYYPDLVDSIVLDPDDIYRSRNFDEMHKKGIADKYFFSSQAGQDNFCVVYSYFLKRKTKNRYPKVKMQLFEAYQQINRYYAHWNCGGTYFGHQTWRIIGYAEYDLYNYIKYKEENQIEPDYHKQKALFINILRQRAIDKVNSIQGLYPANALSKMLNAVNKLDKSIDSWYILQKAIFFERQYYVYE